MKQVEAIVAPHLLDDIKDRLTLVGVRGMTMHPVVVFDHSRDPAAKPFANQIRFLIVAADDMTETVVNAVLTVARRGDGSDGQILVVPVVEAIRIRTGETGSDAL